MNDFQGRPRLVREEMRSLRRWSASVVPMLAVGLATFQARAEPWEDFPRTYPQPRYEQDVGANPNHQFGVTKGFPPYRDPPREEAESLPNPLQHPPFDSYNLIVVVNKTKDPFWGKPQTLRVYQRGKGLLYYWLVSTGAPGHETPSGYFLPQGFSSRHWSGPYDAPMLWAVFFNAGISLHSTLDRPSLGELGHAAASHGCVRIEDYRSEELFHLIGHSGFGPVDKIDRYSGQPVLSGNKRVKVSAYKTLIIVGPAKPWAPLGRPGRRSVEAQADGPQGGAEATGAGSKRTRAFRHSLKMPAPSRPVPPEALF